MSNTTIPPRFVPTLTEAISDSETPTKIEDLSYLETRDAPAAKVQQPILPRDWQAQQHQTLRQAVRQELQQQLPFLLLQWSKQIEDKVTPQIQQQLTKMLQSWQTPAN